MRPCVPQLAELLAKGNRQTAAPFMSACIIVTQVVIALSAAWIGRRASTNGRKPLLLIGFGVLPLQGRALHADPRSRNVNCDSNIGWSGQRHLWRGFDPRDCGPDSRHRSLQPCLRSFSDHGRNRCSTEHHRGRSTNPAFQFQYFLPWLGHDFTLRVNALVVRSSRNADRVLTAIFLPWAEQAAKPRMIPRSERNEHFRCGLVVALSFSLASSSSFCHGFDS